MRIPIPLVLFLSICVVAGVWWYGSRNMDFVTPPSESRLAAIREAVESSVPQSEQPENAVAAPVIPVPPPPPPEPPKPVIETGDLRSAPVINEYHDQVTKGAVYLAELAVLLESKGEIQRALLAWERILDSTKPDENQAKTAISAIKRLRPTLPDWNADPKKRIAITLHAGAGKKIAKSLKPALDKTAKEIERASAGILKVGTEVTAGRDARSTATRTPVALWITGPNKKSRSSDVLSFTVASPEKLQQDVELTYFQIIRGFLGHGPSQTPPPDIRQGELPLDAMHGLVTRYFWNELGVLLNHAPE